MSYKGLIHRVPLGGDGLAGLANQARLRPSQLTIANNITLKAGTIQKEGGTSLYNSTTISGSPSVQGGHDWNPSSGTQRMIVFTSDGDLLKDTGGGDFTVTLASGLSVNNVVPHFVEGGKEAAANDRKLFVFTGLNAVQVLAADGATTAAITSPPADWSGANQPSFGVVHEARLWGGGNLNDPHRLYYSTTSDHEDIAGGGTISVYPGEGEKLVAAISFRGFLICWKYPAGIYVVDTTDPTINNWKVKRISQKVGTLNARTVVQAINDIVFFDVSGNPHLLSSTQEFGDINDSSLGVVDNIDEQLDLVVNRAALNISQTEYYEADKEVHWAFAGEGAIANNRRFVIDFNRSDRPRFRISDRDTPISIWLRKDSEGVPRMMIGDDGGFVYELDNDSRSNAGSGYEGKFQTAYMDFSDLDPSLGTKRKLLDFLEIVTEPSGNWNLSMDILHDGSLHETVQFNLGNTGAALGSFILDTDVLAEEQVNNRKARITGSARRIALAGSNSGDGQDFSIAEVMIHFRPGDERL